MSKKLIWEYSNRDKSHLINIFKRPDTIIEVELIGTIYREGWSLELDFLRELSEKKGERIPVLILNYKLKHIDSDARSFALRYSDADSPLSKMATLGDNFFVRCFIELYNKIKKGDTELKAFTNEETAVKWLLNQ